MKGRKRKPRKPRQEEKEASFLEKHGKRLIIASVLVVILAIFIYYLFAVEHVSE